MNSSLTKKIIFDYFDGKNSSMQYKMIEEWLIIKENQELFYQYLDEWESQNPQYSLKTDAKFDKIKLNVAINLEKKRGFKILEHKKHKFFLAKRVGIADGIGGANSQGSRTEGPTRRCSEGTRPRAIQDRRPVQFAGTTSSTLRGHDATVASYPADDRGWVSLFPVPSQCLAAIRAIVRRGGDR